MDVVRMFHCIIMKRPTILISAVVVKDNYEQMVYGIDRKGWHL